VFKTGGARILKSTGGSVRECRASRSAGLFLPGFIKELKEGAPTMGGTFSVKEEIGKGGKGEGLRRVRVKVLNNYKRCRNTSRHGRDLDQLPHQKDSSRARGCNVHTPTTK